jgi:hypothetical protein
VVEFRGVGAAYKEVVHNKGEGSGVGVVSEEHGGGIILALTITITKLMASRLLISTNYLLKTFFFFSLSHILSKLSLSFAPSKLVYSLIWLEKSSYESRVNSDMIGETLKDTHKREFKRINHLMRHVIG